MKLNMTLFTALMHLLIYLELFDIRPAACMTEDLMKRFAPNCTERNNPELCTYDLLATAYSQGHDFNVEEKLSVENYLKKIECMDENDGAIEGCSLQIGNMTRPMAKQDVNFILWTRNTNVTNFNEDHQEFNGKDPTYVIFHGFWNSGTEDWIVRAKDALLQARGSVNVISVDWGSLASPWQSGIFWSYCAAAGSINVVAERTSELIHFLVRSRGLLPSNLHLVGHSLGAHAAGITANMLQTMNNALSPVASITGLDPAGPLFFNRNSSQKLSKDDAAYVQVIHTNGGTNVTAFGALFTNTFGYLDPLGDDDFYPNGGDDQPGCAYSYSCDHSRAYYYWIESVLAVAAPAANGTKPEFTAKTCDSLAQLKTETCDQCTSKCPVMGYYLQNTRSGRNERLLRSGRNERTQHIHYLQTNSTAPYALGRGSTAQTNNEEPNVVGGSTTQTNNEVPNIVGRSTAQNNNMNIRLMTVVSMLAFWMRAKHFIM